MDKQELAGNGSMFGGALTSSASGIASFFSNESNAMLIFSALGAVVAIFGFAYTVWNGNRNYQLALRQYERQLELRQFDLIRKETNHGKDQE